MTAQWVTGKSGIRMPVFLTSQLELSSIKSQLFQSALLFYLYFLSILSLNTLSYCYGFGWFMNSFVLQILGLYFVYGKEELVWCVCCDHRDINKELEISPGAALSNQKSDQVPQTHPTKKKFVGFAEVDSL